MSDIANVVKDTLEDLMKELDAPQLRMISVDQTMNAVKMKFAEFIWESNLASQLATI